MKHEVMVKLMGKMVLVSKVLERQQSYEKKPDKLVSKWWEEKEIESRTGWVVGFRTLQEGYVKPGSPPRQMFDGQEDGGDPDEWRTTGVKKCLLVAFWPTEKPVHVPLDGYTRVSRGGRYIAHLDPEWIRKGGSGCKVEKAPEPYTTAGGWRENPEWRKKNAEFMKGEMKGWPRDEKGQWRKKS